MVQRWNKDNAPLLKYHGSDMYLLAPGLLPCDPLDTPDLRYPNVNTSGKVGAQIRQLPLGYDSSPWGG
jgi:hypothetical protein